jgi:hypothetical protein
MSPIKPPDKQTRDYTRMKKGPRTNPWSYVGVKHTGQDAAGAEVASLEIRQEGAYVGLGCCWHLTVRLPRPCKSVSVTLATRSPSATVVAMTAVSDPLEKKAADPKQPMPQILAFAAENVRILRIDSALDKTLLLKCTYTPMPIAH